MAVHLIVAIDLKGAIGRGGDLLYRLRPDLRRFKALTMGNTVVMGRKTWESLPGALPGRRNIVITRQADYSAPGAETAPSLERALAMAAEGPGEPYIIGGAAIYGAALPLADVLHLTVIQAEAPEADTWLPAPALDRYRVAAVEPAYTDPAACFVTLVRR